MKPYIVVIERNGSKSIISYMSELDNEAEDELVRFRKLPNTDIKVVFDLQDLYRELYC